MNALKMGFEGEQKKRAKKFAFSKEKSQKKN
jgi:hypothetical protein